MDGGNLNGAREAPRVARHRWSTSLADPPHYFRLGVSNCRAVYFYGALISFIHNAEMPVFTIFIKMFIKNTYKKKKINKKYIYMHYISLKA